MPRVLLFGPARQAFGAPDCRLAATSLEELLFLLSEQGGPGLAAVLSCSQLWVNGAPAEPGSPLGDEDEVAVLPPVSGG